MQLENWNFYADFCFCLEYWTNTAIVAIITFASPFFLLLIMRKSIQSKYTHAIRIVVFFVSSSPPPPCINALRTMRIFDNTFRFQKVVNLRERKKKVRLTVFDYDGSLRCIFNTSMYIFCIHDYSDAKVNVGWRIGLMLLLCSFLFFCLGEIVVQQMLWMAERLVYIKLKDMWNGNTTSHTWIRRK